MLDTAIAQVRLAIALLSGRPIPAWALSALIAGARATRHEFGAIGADGAQAALGPTLDAATSREVQLRSFRAQAKRAARDTAYYGTLFSSLGLDPGTLSWDEIARVPLTPKEALREEPDAFVRRGSMPVLRATTHGTTGTPTRVCFSARELRQMGAFAGLASLLDGSLDESDVIQINTAAGALLGNWNLASGAAQVGALVQPAGLVDPLRSLALLAQPLAIPGKKPRVSVLSTYPSYLGDLAETGVRLGYGPTDFGLERILTGGEIVTQGLKARTRRLFGAIAVQEGWGMSEIFPFGGTVCEAGHLHTDPAHGLLEALDPETREPAAPGEIGVLVATPFAPYRETTLLLRYATEDLVRTLLAPPQCSLSHQPATGNLLGKQRLAVHHEGGWVTPRQVLEALEGLQAVPLPARCGFWAVLGGVAVEVVVRDVEPETHRAVTASLEAQGVPLVELHLITDPAQLRYPYPLRGDLREAPFAARGRAVNP
jgi:phenylacetate-coenzyme A ligase PaaK-like adenylate-forming protein